MCVSKCERFERARVSVRCVSEIYSENERDNESERQSEILKIYPPLYYY